MLTRPTESTFATTVVQGAPNRDDGYVASQWHLGIGPGTPTEQALVVYNIDQQDAFVTVQAIDPDVIDQELIVTSTSRVFIERLLPRGGDLEGRSGSWLLPFSI